MISTLAVMWIYSSVFQKKAAWSLWDLAEMQMELEGIFGRSVDLVENGTFRNPFRKQAILSTKEVLYAAS
jgi:predicted nucleotidyltransferase